MMRKFPMDMMFEQPAGWLRVSLSKLEAANRSIAELSRNNSDIDQVRATLQSQAWLERSGVEEADTRFTIIVPVHNEQRSLPSFLGALFLSEIPAAAEVQIIFVVNASTDKSLGLIKKRLACVSDPEEVMLPASMYDSKSAQQAYAVRHHKMVFLVVETPTAGKANALNIGNEIARRQGHQIAINIDANNWVEPDSIAFMYGCARQNMIGTSDSDVVLVNAREYCPTRDMQDVPAKQKTQRAEVSGCMFAWSTKWIHQNHGFPQQAIEDYGTGLLALSQKKRIAESDANIWVFSAANSADENRQIVRFTYGAMQLARSFENDPVATEILLEDFPNLRPFAKRWQYYYDQRKKRNIFLRWLRAVVKFSFNEFLIFQARHRLRRNPHGQTWEPIGSTK
jgi:glycosyltransferase involved in cell wall biosynthesis